MVNTAGVSRRSSNARVAVALFALGCSSEPSRERRRHDPPEREPTVTASASSPRVAGTAATAAAAPSCRFGRLYLGSEACGACVGSHCCSPEPDPSVQDALACLRGARTHTSMDDPEARSRAPDLCYGLAEGKRAEVDALWECIESHCAGCTKL